MDVVRWTTVDIAKALATAAVDLAAPREMDKLVLLRGEISTVASGPFCTSVMDFLEYADVVLS